MEYTKRKPTEFKKAMKLRAAGMQGKDIAMKVGVSEKTISKWIRNSPQIKAQNAQRKLLEKVEKEAGTLTPEEIARLSDSIVKLQKIAYPVD